MRANEFIIEKAMDLDIDTDYGGIKTVKIWANPRLSELQRLVSEYTLRGIVWDKLFLVWDGFDAIHSDVRDHVLKYNIFNFDNIGRTEISVMLSDENNIGDSFDEWQGDAEEVNGIYYMVSHGTPESMPSFRKSLKI